MFKKKMHVSAQGLSLLLKASSLLHRLWFVRSFFQVVLHQRVLIWTRHSIYLCLYQLTYLPISSWIYCTHIYWAPTISVVSTALGTKKMQSKREIKLLSSVFPILKGSQTKKWEGKKKKEELCNSKYGKTNQERKH